MALCPIAIARDTKRDMVACLTALHSVCKNVSQGPMGALLAEALEHVRLAAPVCVGMLANRFIAAVSVVFVGRMGPHYLAPAALATTISNVLGNSVMVGTYKQLSRCGHRSPTCAET